MSAEKCSESAREWQRRAVKAERDLQKIGAEIAEIKKGLSVVEEYFAWQIKAPQRFRVGQRVEFSRKARERNIVPKTRVDRKGTVKKIEDAFGILVQIDGYARPRSFHHAFFNPVSGPKLF